MAPFVVFALILLCSVIWKVKKLYSFWDGKGLPYIGFWQYVQIIYNDFTKAQHDCVLESYRKYGRLYGSYQEIDPCLIVGEPEWIREIWVNRSSSFMDRLSAQQYGNKIWDGMLLTLTGTEWKNTRNIMTPGYTASKLKEMLPKLLRTGRRTADFLVELSARNESANVNEIFMMSALDSVAAIVFSVDVDSNRNPENPFVKYYFNVFGGDNSWKMTVLFRMPRLFKLLRMDVISKEHGSVFSAFVQEIIATRKQSNVKLNDQLQLLLDVLDDTEAKTGEHDTRELGLNSEKRMTLDAVVSQALIFYVGGSDTIASALTYIAYLLAKHPDCQDKVVEEIDSTAGEDEVTYEQLQRLQYTEAVIKEALRLYTPDPMLLRMCTTAATVKGIHFTPGMMAVMPLQALHMDPEYFPQPDAFIPERFLPENKDSVKPYTFLPFGVGPRNCIGMRQALLQLKIALACIYKKVIFERCSETVEQMEFKPRCYLREPTRPIVLRVVGRQ